MLSDFRHAIRSLAKSPGFTAVAVLTLALGIGLSTTVFNGVNPILFRPLPFREPSTLVVIDERNPKQGFDHLNVSYADYTHWRAENQVFTDVGVWNNFSLTLTEGDQPEQIFACQTSDNLFAILGLQPALGRGFSPGEDRPGAPLVALISYDLWTNRFAKNPTAIGKTILLNGKAHTLIGVMPPRVHFPEEANIWVPMQVEKPETTHGNFGNLCAARLKPGVTLAQADADLASIHARLAVENPAANTNVTAFTEPLTNRFLDDGIRSMGWTMLGAVGFVLAIACTNVASLFLTRSLGRNREFAIRGALGSTRWHTLRHLLAESTLIGTAAGMLGCLFALWGTDLVVQLVPVQIPYYYDFSFDGRVLAFAIGISVLTSLIFGLIPARQVSRLNLVTSLNDATRGSSGGRHHQKLRSLFVIAEVALATLLLCGTGLFLHSMLNVQRIDPGFDPARMTVFNLDIGSAPGSTPETRILFYANLLERLRALPGVESATACSGLPMAGYSNGQSFVIEGKPDPGLGQKPVGNQRIAAPGYFGAMKIPLVAGRDFSSADTATSPKVIIIDAAFAQRYFPSKNPIGQRIRWNPKDAASSREIIGIVGDVKHRGLDRDSRPGFYLPHTQQPRSFMQIAVRSVGDNPLGLIPGIRQVVRELNPSIPLHRIRTMVTTISETYWVRRYLCQLMSGFALCALALAAVGIASVIGYSVTQRTQEIGIRLALGAMPSDILRLLLGQGMRLVFTGLILGLVASLALTQVLANLLYEIKWLDPLSLLASTTVFTATALLACWLPARRATRVNPMEALRAE